MSRDETTRAASRGAVRGAVSPSFPTRAAIDLSLSPRARTATRRVHVDVDTTDSTGEWWGSVAAVPGTGGLFAARAAAGVAMGVASVGAPMYVAEAAPPTLRGLMGSFFNIGVNLGVLFPALGALW